MNSYEQETQRLGYQRELMLLRRANAELLAALRTAISSGWLSIDHPSNRTREAVDVRAAMIDAIDKATQVQS